MSQGSSKRRACTSHEGRNPGCPALHALTLSPGPTSSGTGRSTTAQRNQIKHACHGPSVARNNDSKQLQYRTQQPHRTHVGRDYSPHLGGVHAEDSRLWGVNDWRPHEGPKNASVGYGEGSSSHVLKRQGSLRKKHEYERKSRADMGQQVNLFTFRQRFDSSAKPS